MGRGKRAAMGDFKQGADESRGALGEKAAWIHPVYRILGAAPEQAKQRKCFK